MSETLRTKELGPIELSFIDLVEKYGKPNRDSDQPESGYDTTYLFDASEWTGLILPRRITFHRDELPERDDEGEIFESYPEAFYRIELHFETFGVREKTQEGYSEIECSDTMGWIDQKGEPLDQSMANTTNGFVIQLISSLEKVENDGSFTLEQ